MSAVAATCLLLGGFIIAVPSVASRAAPPSLQCDHSLNLYACNGAARVTIGGNGSRSAQKPRSGTRAPVVDPPGAIRLVACGSGTAAELVALGDPAALSDALSCAGWTKQCQQFPPGRNGLLTAAVRVVKQADGSWSLGGSVCRQPATPQVTATLVRQQVARLVPSAAIGVAPQESTLVNIQTIMWVVTAPQRSLAPLTILGRRVVVTLRFDHVVWDFGDGHTESAATPGKPYDETHDPCKTVDCPDYYGHAYVETGTMTLTAAASWAASFTVDGGRTLTIPGTVAGPAATTTLQVKQARGVLVPDPTPS